MAVEHASGRKSATLPPVIIRNAGVRRQSTTSSPPPTAQKPFTLARRQVATTLLCPFIHHRYCLYFLFCSELTSIVPTTPCLLSALSRIRYHQSEAVSQLTNRTLLTIAHSPFSSFTSPRLSCLTRRLYYYRRPFNSIDRSFQPCFRHQQTFSTLVVVSFIRQSERYYCFILSI